LTLCSVFGCRREPTADQVSPTPAPAPVVAPATAAVEPSVPEFALFAQSFVKDWIQGARHALYVRMSPEYREAVTEAQFGQILDGANRTLGKVQEAEYKSVEIGTFVSFSGVKKIWALVYALRTETHAKGTYFAKITLVAKPWLAVQSFDVVTFPLGAPPFFR
jgi:hypothetical protein